MSSAILNQFVQDISQDTNLQQQLQEATNRESLVNKMVELGNEKGYSFTPSETEEWLESMANQSGASGELSEEQLEAVAGGASAGGAGTVGTDWFMRFPPR
ncbi:MAG TPA: Nif11-like leader peptide family natural product precursor [Cyanobacteria bacterium UBA11372]|nr:Nif11-like leader peptide family natural product precursor [Cyanobacteria bacterium UBA11372]HBE51761.1 Nif11-like leader peptide family natural product precursor [Cyanobacteria bacterium UBA11369]